MMLSLRTVQKRITLRNPAFSSTTHFARSFTRSSWRNMLDDRDVALQWITMSGIVPVFSGCLC